MFAYTRVRRAEFIPREDGPTAVEYAVMLSLIIKNTSSTFANVALNAAASGGTALTSLGVATGAVVKNLSGGATASWGGQTVHAADTLVIYTYAGDTNLDGTINGDDYFNVDSTYPGGTG